MHTMRTIRMNPGIIAALAVSAGGATAAEPIPSLLDVLPPRTISPTFDAPDWITYALAEFNRHEDALRTVHPRAHAKASNLRHTEAESITPELSVWDLCESGHAARLAAVVASPRLEAFARSDPREITRITTGRDLAPLPLAGIDQLTDIASTR